MDALLLLESEHEIVRTLLEILITGPKRGPERKALLLKRLVEVLSLHSAVEEDILNGIVTQRTAAAADQVLAHECLVQHHAIKRSLLPELLIADPESRAFEGRLLALRAYLERLFKQEEGALFPIVLTFYSQSEIEAIGAKHAAALK
jgi:hypothetical protein